MFNKSILVVIFVFFSSFLSAKTIELSIDKAKLINLPENARSVFIANPEIVDYQTLTNTKVSVFGKKAGVTSIIALDIDENIILEASINVEHDVKSLNKIIKSNFPDAFVTAESIAGKLFLKGHVATPVEADNIYRIAAGFTKVDLASQNTSGDAASDSSAGSSTSGGQQGNNDEPSPSSQTDEIINQMVVTMPNQVNLRVRIAEVSRNVSNQLGVKWADSSKHFSGGWNGSKGSPGVLSFFDQQFSVTVDALAENGLISVLAEPNLTALSGEFAKFLVGGEVALPLVLNDTASIEYKAYGVQLAFKPTVLGPDRISLVVAPEVSMISVDSSYQAGNILLPNFTTRKASTTIELASGQSFVLGGLLQSRDIEDMQKVPFLGDVPILGSLFRSSAFKREETELLIIATAYLVNPIRSDSFTLPTDGLLPPSDLERLLALPEKNARNELNNKSGLEGNLEMGISDNQQPRLLGDNGFYY